MHAQRIPTVLYRITGLLLCAILVSACGQKGPLTLPQATPEVAEPVQQKIDDKTEQQR